MAKNGRVILSEQRLLERHRTDQRQYDNGTALRRFILGVVIGLPFSWLLIAHERWTSRLARRRTERKGAGMSGDRVAIDAVQNTINLLKTAPGVSLRPFFDAQASSWQKA